MQGPLQGRTTVVTGANAGIGYETAKTLAALGAEVVMACRSEERGQDARTRLLQQVPEADVSLAPLDLADPDSIQAFAKAVGKHHRPVDVLVNNAGVWNRTRRESVEGHELTFAVNLLGTFRVTQALLPSLQEADAGRVVTVASAAHWFAKPDWDDLQMTTKYDGDRQYSNTKLYDIWYSDALARRLEGTSVTSNALHPGSGHTDLQSDFPSWVMPLAKPFLKSTGKLAETSIRLATDPALANTSGGYYHLERRARRSRRAKDEEASERLWAVAEDLA